MSTKSLLLMLSVCACVLAGPLVMAGPRVAVARSADDDQIEAVKIYARGDYAAAIALLEPRHQAGQANIQQRLILARSYLHLARRDDALAVLKSVLATDKENPEANALGGKIRHDRGEHKQALEYLQRAYRLKRDPATASLLGQCHYALGETVKAKVHLEKALAADIRDPANSLLLGKICLARGMGALAQKYLLMAQEAGLSSAELCELLGRAYLLQRKYVGPVRARHLEGNPSPGDVVDGGLVLGPIEGLKDQYKICTHYCALYQGHRLLKVRPASTEARFMLAAGWLAAGNTKLAAEHLKPLLRAPPLGARVADLQVRLLLATKDYAAVETALVTAAQAKSLEAGSISRFYYHAATAVVADGRPEQAIRLLTQAEKLTPTSGVVLRLLAALHLNAGHKDQARQYYARLVELFPDADDIDQLRNKLAVLSDEKGGAQ